MKHFKLKIIWAATLVFSLFHTVAALGQCVGVPIKLVHTAGIVSFGCTDVNVTSEGGVTTTPVIPCNYDPYVIGVITSGSYTFTFSAPVEGVTIDITSLTYRPDFSIVDEIFIDVNGTFYPLASPGTYDNCLPQAAVVTPQGTLQSPYGLGASTKDIYIPGPIYSLKVTDDTVGNNLCSSVNFSLYMCCACCSNCVTDAGVISSNNIETCTDEPAVVPPASQTELDADDILQYILYTDIASPSTSILAISNSPSFSFNPATMATGITYYIAAIAGNELNGNVDGADPCWDISNTIEVKWWPEPTVAFTSTAECLHADGSYDINISFTGNPPFNLTGQVVLGGNVIATFDNSYSFFSEVLVVYLPPTTPNGSLTIEALSLSDAHCTCN